MSVVSRRGNYCIVPVIIEFIIVDPIVSPRDRVIMTMMMMMLISVTYDFLM